MIADLIGWFQERRAPASWICGPEVAPPDLRERLVRQGCQPERAGIAMGGHIRSLDLDEAPLPEGVRLERVATPAALHAWLAVAEQCRWMETQQNRAAFRSLRSSLGLRAEQPLRHYLALRDERAVGMASAFFAGRIVILADLAVVEEERRRGIGRALAVARLLEARQAGCEAAVLAPTPQGVALYRSLGFSTSPSVPDRWFYLPLDFEQSEAQKD